MTLNNKWKHRLLYGTGLVLCVVPPLIATLCFFPLFIEKSAAATVSGIGMILAIVSIVPVFRWAKKHFSAEAAPLLWIVFAALAYVGMSIAEQVFKIAVIGAISNIGGWVLFRIAKKYEETKE